MTIFLDNEVVASRHDPVARMNHYTIERGGRRWTVSVHLDDFNRHGGNVHARRAHLGNLLQQAMTGKADGE